MKNEEFIKSELLFLSELVKDVFGHSKYHTHSLDHSLRVRNNCLKIGEKLGADLVVLEVSALFHDFARREEVKGDCHAQLSAEYTQKLLEKRNWDKDIIAQICYAIKNHRYSQGITPETLEAKILQDADKLDALGALGIIRVCQYNPKLPFYDLNDPFCEHRTLSKEYTIDHFYDKILKLIDGFHTEEALKIAKQKHQFTLNFLEQLKKEI